MQKLNALGFQKRLVDGSMVCRCTCSPELQLNMPTLALELHAPSLVQPSLLRSSLKQSSLTCYCSGPLQFVGEKKPYKTIEQLWDGEVETVTEE